MFQVFNPTRRGVDQTYALSDGRVEAMLTSPCVICPLIFCHYGMQISQNARGKSNSEKLRSCHARHLSRKGHKTNRPLSERACAQKENKSLTFPKKLLSEINILANLRLAAFRNSAPKLHRKEIRAKFSRGRR